MLETPQIFHVPSLAFHTVRGHVFLLMGTSHVSLVMKTNDCKLSYTVRF